MANRDDIRWIQRFSNYNKALVKLNDIINYIQANQEEEQEAILDDIMR